MSPKRMIVGPRGEARGGALALIAVAVGAAAWIEGCALLRRAPTAEGDLLKFSHATHEQYTPDCATCHVDPDFKVIGRATHLSCVECHVTAAEEARPSADCLLCHHTIEPERIFKAPRPDYSKANFDHVDHAAASCAQCHGEVTEMRGRPEPIRFPRMESCLECHAPNISEVSRADCFMCHFAIDPGTIPESHRHPAWDSTHGFASNVEPNLCARCHVQASDCEICHSMNPPPNHTAVFRARTHGFSALNNPNTCQVCHTQDFCEACHRTTEPANHTASFTGPPWLHCANCHLPLEEGNRCSVCHEGDPHEFVFAAPPPPILVEAGLIDLSEPCLPCHPVALVPIPHPYNTLDSLQCIQCHRPLEATADPGALSRLRFLRR